MTSDRWLKPDDVPSPIDLRDAETARRWLEDAEERRPYRAELRARIAELVAARSARRVLELGGGPGLLAAAIVERVTAEYVLVDFSPPMLAMANARLPELRTELRDLRDPAWSDGLGMFDAVVTMQAVHELRHKRRAVDLYRQVHALLAPGALFVVCDHEPSDERPLFMPASGQHAALTSAGFGAIETAMSVGTLYVIAATRH